MASAPQLLAGGPHGATASAPQLLRAFADDAAPAAERAGAAGLGDAAARAVRAVCAGQPGDAFGGLQDALRDLCGAPGEGEAAAEGAAPCGADAAGGAPAAAPAAAPHALAAGLAFAARAVAAALDEGRPALSAQETDPAVFSLQLPEPAPDGDAAEAVHAVSGLQCLEILAAGFFGVLCRRGWGRRKHAEASRDMPPFTFEKLWAYDGGRWGTKNIVLMGVLLYFQEASRLGLDALRAQQVTITRKAIGPVGKVPEDLVFCPCDLQEDGVSIHAFDGDCNLQADFANEYLGGGVLSGGGSQEEAMFVEYTGLLVTMYLVERMLPHEAVEVSGVRRYTLHNMMAARRCGRAEQFCRAAPVPQAAAATVVALDALCFNAHGSVSKWDQYQPQHIRREVRKCLAALRPPAGAGAGAAPRRRFVTGLWGCGAFRGDPELKCIVQWICCSLEPSIDRMIFCPFDQRKDLVDKGLAQLLQELPGRVTAKAVLDALVEDPEYLKARSTFQHVLHKLRSSGAPPTT